MVHGFATLISYYKFWGESKRETRNHIFTVEIVEVYRNATTCFAQLSRKRSYSNRNLEASYNGDLCMWLPTISVRGPWLLNKSIYSKPGITEGHGTNELVQNCGRFLRIMH